MTKRNEQSIGLIDISNHQFDSATIDKIKSNYSDASLIEAIVILREAYFLDEAIDLAEFGVDRYSYRTRFYALLSDLLTLDGKNERALVVVNRGLLGSPFDTELIVTKTRILSSLGEYNQAQTLLDDLTVHSSFIGDSVLFIAQACLSKARKEYQQMYHFAKLAFAIEPHLHSVHQVFGESIELSREYSDAIAFLNDQIDDSPYHYLAWFYLGHAYAYKGRYDRAISSFEYAFIAEKNYRQAYVECADLCVELGHWRKNILVNLELIERFGENPESFSQMTKSYLQLDLWEDAEKCVQTLAKIDPDHEDLWSFIGECHIKKRNWKMAIMSYRNALEIDEDQDEYLFRIARSYEKLDDFTQAISYFRRSIEIGPEQYEYWYHFIKYLLRKKKFEQALDIIDEAEEHTYSYKLSYLKAACLFYLNRKKESHSTLEEVLQDGHCDHDLLIKVLPESRKDNEIVSMLEFYRK